MIFGDSVPEDAWDRGDPIPVLLDNLCRRCTLLGEPRIIIDATPAELLDDVRHRLGRIRRRQLSDEDKHRAEMIAEDVEYLFGRLEEERDD